VGVELAVLVVDLYLTLAVLVGHKDVLIEHARHGRGALVDTAPSLNVASLGMCVTNHQSDGLFANDEHLLKLHLVVFVVSVQGRFHVVLNLGLGLLALVSLLEVD